VEAKLPSGLLIGHLKQGNNFSGQLNFMHTYNYCPSSFTNIWTQNADNDSILNLRNTSLLTVPHPRIELFRKLPLYSLPTLWNALEERKLQLLESALNKKFDESD
jgi:hypothetical protein